jgi:3-hexulose-6-phosphate synthase
MKGQALNSRSAGPLLQVALDTLSTIEAERLLGHIYPQADIIEIGTPLIIEAGLAALEQLKAKYPDKHYLADLKIMDAGYLEASSGFKRGADIVTVLGVADDSTIQGVQKAAAEHGKLVMADLINVPNLEERARQLEALGIAILCVHTAYDRQSSNINPLAELERARPVVNCRLAAAGGLNLATASEAVRAGADIVVVGGGITNQSNPREAARRIIESIRSAA